MKVYLDNNATSPLHEEVRQKMIDFMDLFGNASSAHSFGREAKYYLEEARKQVAHFLGASSEEIIFTSGGSEANNLVLKGIGCNSSCVSACNGRKLHIITSVIEHPSVLNTCQCLESSGVEVTYLPVDKYGLISLKELEKAIKENTVLVSIMYANNEIGTIEPIKEIAELAHSKNVKVHTDAVQAVGKIKFKVSDIDVDFLSLSGHKLYGPKGIGALYMKKGHELCSLITGGHQEGEIRAGTENNLGIIALGEACRFAEEELDAEIKRLMHLREKLESGIFTNISDVILNGHPDKRLPGTLNVTFRFIEGESILLRLDMAGIAVSTGSACSSGSLDPSHVITALGVEQEDAHGSIRFSIGRQNTEAEIDYVLEVLPKIIKSLRDLSPIYPGK
jgi:cysteine desulfurase